jgi:hypothetical protein
MTPDIKNYLLAMISILPAALGIYKYKRTDIKFHPFIYMILLIVIIENITYWLPKKFPGMIPYVHLSVNIYAIVNFGLFLYFVSSNNYLSKKLMAWFFAAASLVWFVCYFLFGTAFVPFFYFLCFVSAVMLFTSINILSRQILEIKTSLFNNSWFWVSGAFIFYNAFILLIFSLFVFSPGKSAKSEALSSIHPVVNAVCYIFYTIALYKLVKNPKDNPLTKPGKNHTHA